MTPRVHKRERVVTDARIDLTEKVLDWRQGRGRDLTNAELVSVLTSVLSDQLLGWAKYQIRYERHGNTDTPGGWES